jgi:hypothetical protein
VEDRVREDGVDRLAQPQLGGSSRSTSARSPISSRALATIAGAASTAITRPRGTRSISIAVTRPLPQPASSTVSSPLSSSRSSTGPAHSTCGLETRS